MSKKLKLWNGGAGCCRKPNDPVWAGILPYSGSHHVYAAAHSMADLRALITEYCGRDPGPTELRSYWNAGTWGDGMNGVTPERGLWLCEAKKGKAPIRLI